MTRNDFSTALILATFALFAIRTDMASLAAFACSVALHAGLVLLPYVFDSGASALRKELHEILEAQHNQLKDVKARLDTLTLSRGGR